MYVAIMNIDGLGSVTKYADGFDTLEDAQAHVDNFTNEYPDAFAVATPTGGVKYWVADTVLKTVSYDGGQALASAIANKIQQVNDLRNQKMSSDFTHNTKTFDANQSVQIIINHTISYGEITNAPDIDLMNWTLADNTTVGITWGDFRAMAIALFERGNALHGEARTHKDTLLAMTDIADVEAYDITIGWTA